MNYIIDFEICAALFLTITLVFFLAQKQLPTMQNTVFGTLVWVALFNIFLSILTVVTDAYSQHFSQVFLYALNIIYLSISNILPVVFYFYTYVLSEKTEGCKWKKIFMCVPEAIVLLLIITTPFTHYIFYLDQVKKYTYGVYYLAIYFSAIFYLASSGIRLYCRRKFMDTKIMMSALIFIVMFILTLLIQLQEKFRNLLIADMASALALNILYNSLQTANNHIDVVTKLFNRSALSQIVSSMYEKKKNFQIFLFVMHDFSPIRYSIGEKKIGGVISLITKYLQTEYSSGTYLFHLQDSSFAVITKQLYTQDDAKWFLSKFPSTFNVDQTAISISKTMIVLNSSIYKNPSEVIATVDYILSPTTIKSRDDVIFADVAFKEHYQYDIQVELALRNAINLDKIDVYFQPITAKKDNVLFAAEALARLIDDKMGFISPEIFIPIAESNGTIVRLGYQIFKKVCEFLSNNDIRRMGIDHINVNLSVVQCMQDNMHDQLDKIAREYSVSPNLICFEITETATTASMASLKKNMSKLTEMGYSFSLDDYGTGYSNIEYIMQLPIKYIKFDRAVVRSAIGDSKKATFLKELIEMFREMNIQPVAEGIESLEQLEVVSGIGINYIQGYYYSKPLNIKDFTDYIYEHRRIIRRRLS